MQFHIQHLSVHAYNKLTVHFMPGQPSDTTKLLYVSLFTSKPLTSRLASSMVWLVRATSS